LAAADQGAGTAVKYFNYIPAYRTLVDFIHFCHGILQFKMTNVQHTGTLYRTSAGPVKKNLVLVIIFQYTSSVRVDAKVGTDTAGQPGGFLQLFV
jgi:hypothetical protein